MLLCFLALVAQLIPLTAALTPNHHASQNPAAHLIYEFPVGTRLENLAVRQNGQVLVTPSTSPDLYLLDPITPNSPVLIHTFPNHGLLGITELHHDVFYLVAGNVTPSVPDFAYGTYSIWKVNMISYDEQTQSGAQVSKVVDMPEADLLNGMTVLDKTKNQVIIADSPKGVIWLLDVETAKYRILLDEPEMKAPANAPIPLGINGIKVLYRSPSDSPKSQTHSRNDIYIYFTNTEGQILCRIPFSLSTLTKTGAVETLASLWADDLALGTDGYAYLTGGTTNSILSVPLEGGSPAVVVGGLNETTVAGPTACLFGRGKGQERTLLVVTNGGTEAPVNGIVQGGKLVAVDLGRW